MEYRGLINLRLCLNVAVGQKGKNTCRYKLTYLTYPFSFEGKLVQYIEDAIFGTLIKRGNHYELCLIK